MTRFTSALSLVAISIGAVQLCAQQSSGTAPHWTLQPDLRIGGAADGPTNFVEIRGIALTRTGNIFVLEFKQQDLFVFDSKGALIRRAGRHGAGPGELSNANGLAIGADDIVWMNDPSNSRFSLYRADGTFLKQVVVPINGYGYIWRGAVVGSDRLLDDLALRIPNGKTDATTGRPSVDYKLRLLNSAAKVDTVDIPRCPPKPISAPATLVFGSPKGHGQSFVSIPFRPFQQAVYTRAGTVWCTPSDEYRLLTGPIGGTLKEVVHREFPAVPVTAAERQTELHRIDSLKASYGTMESGDPLAIPSIKPAISQLFADDKGHVWVRRSGVAEAKPVFEVYDATGRQLATVTSNGPVGYQSFIAGDALLTVNLDDDDVPFVVRYQIVKH